MWLISNPLFEIGAGLVLFAATIWMLLNATAPRPAALQAPVAAAPSPLAVAESVPSLGPLSIRATKGMFFADDVEGAPVEPPLRLAPEPRASTSPSPEMRFPDLEPSQKAGPLAPPLVRPPLSAEPAPAVVETLQEPITEPAPLPAEPLPPDPEPPSAEAFAPVVIEAQPPPIEVEPVALEAVAPGMAAAEGEAGKVGAAFELAPPPEPHSLLEEFGEALAASSVVPIGPVPSAEPSPGLSFETQFQDWLRRLLEATPGAPPLATVTAAAARVKRSTDPAWPEPARDLRATIDSLGKLAPAAFGAPGARDATVVIAEAAGEPLALIWPKAGAVFDPTVHDARSGEGDGVASVIRPGLAYGGVTELPALVVRGPASSSSASA